MSRGAAKKPTRRAPPGLEARRFEVAGEPFVVFRFPTTTGAPSDAPPSEPLSASEADILRMIVAGRSNQEIAAARSTSVRTVANQVASILKKMNVGSRFELARRDLDSHLNVQGVPVRSK